MASPKATGDRIAARLVCLLSLTGQGMWSNRFQLSLTLMTMAVGSFALSLTFFLGEGARIRLWQDMEHLMGDWVIASPGVRQDSHLLETRLRPDFTPEDFTFVKDHLKDVRLVAPMFQATEPVTFRSINRVMAVDGVTVELSREPLFLPIRGRGFSDAGHQGLVWECLLTKSAAEALAVTIEDEPTVDPFK